jgi:hypothetical protein
MNTIRVHGRVRDDGRFVIAFTGASVARRCLLTRRDAVETAGPHACGHAGAPTLLAGAF